LYDLVRDDYRWPEVSRAPLLLSIDYRATDIESNIDPWQTGIPIDPDLLQYVSDTLGTQHAGDLLAFKDNWTFWADQEIKMLADSGDFDSAMQSTALPDIIAGEANDTVETQRSPPGELLACQYHVRRDWYMCPRHLVDYEQQVWFNEREHWVSEGGGWHGTSRQPPPQWRAAIRAKAESHRWQAACIWMLRERGLPSTLARSILRDLARFPSVSVWQRDLHTVSLRNRDLRDVHRHNSRLADSGNLGSALQSTALPDIIAGKANDTVETQHSPPGELLARQHYGRRGWYMCPRHLVDYEQQVWLNERGHGASEGGGWHSEYTVATGIQSTQWRAAIRAKAESHHWQAACIWMLGERGLPSTLARRILRVLARFLSVSVWQHDLHTVSLRNRDLRDVHRHNSRLQLTHGILAGGADAVATHTSGAGSAHSDGAAPGTLEYPPGTVVNRISAKDFLPLAQGALQAGAADPGLNLLQLLGNSTLIKGHQPQLLLADTLSPVRARTASYNLEAELQRLGPQTYDIDRQLQRRYAAGSFVVGADILNTPGTMDKLLTMCRSVLHTPLGQWSASTWSGSRQMFLVLAECGSAEHADKLISTTTWCGGSVQLNSLSLALNEKEIFRIGLQPENTDTWQASKRTLTEPASLGSRTRCLRLNTNLLARGQSGTLARSPGRPPANCPLSQHSAKRTRSANEVRRQSLLAQIQAPGAPASQEPRAAHTKVLSDRSPPPGTTVPTPDSAKCGNDDTGYDSDSMSSINEDDMAEQLARLTVDTLDPEESEPASGPPAECHRVHGWQSTAVYERNLGIQAGVNAANWRHSSALGGEAPTADPVHSTHSDTSEEAPGSAVDATHSQAASLAAARTQTHDEVAQPAAAATLASPLSTHAEEHRQWVRPDGPYAVDTTGTVGPAQSQQQLEDSFFAAAVTDSDEDDLADDDNWLSAEDGRAFDRRIAGTKDLARQFLNGLADLPTQDQLDSMLSAPDIPAKDNAAEGYPDTSPPFVAGCIHGDNPVAQAELWRKRIPHLSSLVYRWISENGVTAKPSSDEIIDEPRRRCEAKAQVEVDKAIRKSIEVGSSRLWDRELEGDPTFCTPVGAVPKKDSAETWRKIDDYTSANERFSPWKKRFEKISMLGATGCKQGHYAVALDFKSGYTVLKCQPHKYFAYRARVRRSWLQVLRSRYTADTHKPPLDGSETLGAVDADDTADPWIEVTLANTALIQGSKQSCAIYTHLIRQLVKKWRRVDNISMLNYIDDCLFTAPTADELRRKLRIVADDCAALLVPISWEKTAMTPQQIVSFLGFTLDLGTGLIHLDNGKAKSIVELARELQQAGRVGSSVPMRRIAKLTGKLMAASRALMPARLMSKDCFALLTAKNKHEWDNLVAISPAALAEIGFWCSNLLKWNAAGRALFPSSQVIDVKLEGDASPQGWGAQGARVTLDGTLEGSSEHYEQWSKSEEQLDQTTRELLALDRAIQAWGQSGTDFTDKTVRATLQSNEAKDWLHIPAGTAFQRLKAGDTVLYSTDNQGVRAAINKGISKSSQLHNIVRRIWVYMLSRGSRLEVTWVAGSQMITSGTDGLSRKRCCLALHRVEYKQTYASLSTKTRPSPFLCIGWSIGQNLCSTLHENLLIMTPIYIIYIITSRPAIHPRPGKSRQR
jgi:hypothetical protein